MNFLENIFASLQRAGSRIVLQEIREGEFVPVSGSELLAEVESARVFLHQAGVGRGDRCALLAPNSIRWVALDLALTAEGAMAVPLYPRQPAAELISMMKDCSPALLCCGDAQLRDSILSQWPEAPRAVLLDEIFSDALGADALQPVPLTLEDNQPITIIYTSGTSGEPKGVVLTVKNVSHILECTRQRLDALMSGGGGLPSEPESVFHYAPFCFAASWILLLSCLSRNSTLSLCTDFSRIAQDMRLVAPHYFSNVPLMLERMRARIEEQILERGRAIEYLFTSAEREWLRRRTGGGSWTGDLSLRIARYILFPKIRQALGPNLKALICGSAALSPETQLFFMMLGVPVLQVYGLTETTAICTMDHPARVEPGWVGQAIPGVYMKLGPADEILVRGPNLFLGYWNRPEATADSMTDGWFRTGDQGEVNENGTWRITGRVKNVLVLASGHNVAPEPIEDKLRNALPAAKQVVVMGAGRNFLSALITGDVSREQVEAALEHLNSQLPHYKRVHGFHIVREPFGLDSGLLTAMGKLKRDAIAAAYCGEIEALYNSSRVTAGATQ